MISGPLCRLRPSPLRPRAHDHAQDCILVRTSGPLRSRSRAARDEDDLETASHSLRDQPAKAGAVTDGMRLRDRDTAFDQEALCRGKEARGSTRA